MARKPGKIERVKLSDLKVNDEFAPKPDPVFNHLLAEALRGRLPAYFAIIPMRRLKRFDKTHRPEITVAGKKIVAGLIERWRDDGAWPMWVYPSGTSFIASDDYFMFSAYEQAKLERAACYVLGTPDGAGVTDIEGPLSVAHVKKALGFG